MYLIVKVEDSEDDGRLTITAGNVSLVSGKRIRREVPTSGGFGSGWGDSGSKACRTRSIFICSLWEGWIWISLVDPRHFADVGRPVGVYVIGMGRLVDGYW